MASTQRYAYYPGCALESTAGEYHRSILEVCQALGIELVEIPDWTCCGASSAHMTDYWLSHALPARNLALAEEQGMDIAVACPACFQRLKSTQLAARDDPELKERLIGLIDLTWGARYEVRHILDIIYHDIGAERMKEEVTRPLEGLKVACYYGCYLVRPPKLTGCDDPENPQTMDRLLQAAGAEVLDWDGKVECCGGSLALSEKGLAAKLVTHIAKAAQAAGAEALVTACPLCQLNLEMRQDVKKPLPVFYFTELLGLALGLFAGSWLQKHLISPLRLLRRHRLLD
ncbi:CoB--CoM heterodisulfide reductase iron-sulfur subunit B family protein [Chloroflexota bacterium]